MRKRTISAAVITATTVLSSVLAAQGAASAAPSAKAIPNTQPAWTAHAKQLGHASKTGRVTARVYLAPRGGLAAVADLATAQSTKGSAQYRHFLTPAQYRARFMPTSSTVSSVASFLTSAGLKVSSVASHNTYVSITGTVAAAEKAFGTSIEKYRHNGKQVQAPSSKLSVPAGLASSVLTISGLDTSKHTVTPASKQQAPPPAGFRNARPCSTYYGQLTAKYKADFQTPLPKFRGKYLSYAPCGYTGPQYRAAYEQGSALDGTGITVGIIDAYAAPTIASDANTYASNHGDGSYVKGQLTQTTNAPFTNQAACDPSGWYGEETLDVEAVHAMAPGANIHYYGSKSCFNDDFIDIQQKAVNQDKVQLVSNSYGNAGEGVGSDEIAASESVVLQGATEGISFMFSSGDSGDELANTGIKSADYEASDPYVTAVGGTSTGIDANGALSLQTGWGTDNYSLSSDGKSWTGGSFLYGAGGGTSSLFNRPSYQDGYASSPYRTVPDVAMDADPNTGMLIGETQTFSNGVYYDEYRIGGTSLASPLFAGMTALSLENSGGKGVGLLNPYIYSSKSAKSGAFTDVLAAPASQAGVVRVNFVNSEDATDGLSYFVRTFDDDSSLATTKGYDEVTGVGVPNPTWFNAFK